MEPVKDRDMKPVNTFLVFAVFVLGAWVWVATRDLSEARSKLEVKQAEPAREELEPAAAETIAKCEGKLDALEKRVERTELRVDAEVKRVDDLEKR